MINFFKQINKKINGVIISFVVSGFALVLLAVLIVWTDLMIRLVLGMVVLLVAYMFFYGGYKVWMFKKAIKAYLKIK